MHFLPLLQSKDVLITLFILTIILLVGFLFVLARLARLQRVYMRLTRGTSGGNLEEILTDYMRTVEQTVDRMDQMEALTADLGRVQRTCMQKVGLVRFNAFDDIGGEQSFAVALLDDMNNGVIFSSMYSRSDVRVYAKALQGGSPSHPLTREEEQALARARGK